ncbi:MAG: hypothetical protein JXA00_04320 [Candidatus Thermoplasmatota archaeon]|nr:hypothetical protein [Candidatus Thermoplasmatota archaeon]
MTTRYGTTPEIPSESTSYTCAYAATNKVFMQGASFDDRHNGREVVLK